MPISDDPANINNCPSLTDAILESISDGVFTVDAQWRITSFNRAAEEITGVDREEAVGRPCFEVFRANMCESECALKKTLETGEPIVNRSAYIIDADGQRIPISVSTALLRDETGEIIGGAETFRDLSLEEALQRELTGRFTMGDMVSRSLHRRPKGQTGPVRPGDGRHPVSGRNRRGEPRPAPQCQPLPTSGGFSGARSAV